jgi:hypothetical protein
VSLDHELPHQAGAAGHGDNRIAISIVHALGENSITPIGASWQEPRDCFVSAGAPAVV